MLYFVFALGHSHLCYTVSSQTVPNSLYAFVIWDLTSYWLQVVQFSTGHNFAVGYFVESEKFGIKKDLSAYRKLKLL